MSEINFDKLKNNDEEISSFSNESEKKNGFVGCLRENLFMILILIGVAAGFGIGFGVKAVTNSDVAQIWIEMPGVLYIRLLQLTILPLIATNLIIIISGLNPKEQGKSSLITFAYIIGFNLVSAATGVAFASIIKPGENVKMARPDVKPQDPNLTATTSDVFADLLLNIFPDNIFGMCIYQSKSEYNYVMENGNITIERSIGLKDETNLIGVLFVSICFGLAARGAKTQGEPFINLIRSLSEVVLKLVRVFLLCTPVGVCFMIAGAVMKVPDVVSTFQGLGLFIVTVTVGLGFIFILVVVLYAVIVRRNPFPFLPHIIQSWFISFATTSPIVALPEMFAGCDAYGIDKTISRFVCPITTTLKADGPAVFISTAAVFVAQMESEPVSTGTLVIIWILTSVSVLAIPHIPSASIIITMTILASAGVPPDNTAYLYAVDWLLDRFRAGLLTIVSMYVTAMIDFLAHGHRQVPEKINTPSTSSWRT